MIFPLKLPVRLCNLNSLSSKNSCDFPRVISLIFSQGSRPYVCKGKCIIAVKRNVFTPKIKYMASQKIIHKKSHLPILGREWIFSFVAFILTLTSVVTHSKMSWMLGCVISSTFSWLRSKTSFVPLSSLKGGARVKKWSREARPKTWWMQA